MKRVPRGALVLCARVKVDVLVFFSLEMNSKARSPFLLCHPKPITKPKVLDVRPSRFSLALVETPPRDVPVGLISPPPPPPLGVQCAPRHPRVRPPGMPEQKVH